MGNTVVLDQTLCYLISNNDDEIFIFPRVILDPELTTHCRLKNTFENSRYIESNPWNKILNYETKTQIFEQEVRKIFIESKKPAEIEIYKAEFIKYKSLWYNNEITIRDPSKLTHDGVMQLFSLLSAFCWVSKAFQFECIEHGPGYNKQYDFRIYEKSLFSFAGAKGKLLFSFQWDSFCHILIKNLNTFSISTNNKYSWGACMGLNGFDSK